MKYLKENGYRSRYVSLAQDAKAHSDDEQDPSTGCWYIKTKPERSIYANRFYRTLDERMKMANRLRAVRTNIETRVLPPSPQPE